MAMMIFKHTMLYLFLLSICLVVPQQALANEDGDGCVDIIEDHPVCLFGRICDCQSLTSSPDYPCGSTMTSSGQSIQVNELCPQTCNACDNGDTVPEQDTTCRDGIANHPLCLFAQLCSCDTDILSTYSCEDVITTGQGSVQVTEVCAASCNACDGETSANDPPSFTGPVHGHVPMGTVDGQRSDLFYTVGQEDVKFTMIFPDTAVWAAFQFWGGDYRGLTDGRLSKATSGFECLVGEDDEEQQVAVTTKSHDNNDKASHVHCRARRVRHLFTRFEDLPGPASDLINQYSVTSCTSERALVTTAAGEPFCNHDPLNVHNSSLIISSSSGTELVFVTDVLSMNTADMSDIQVTHNAANATFTATWSRSRSYPWGVQGDGTTLNMRWAVSPRGASAWVEGDLPYHGLYGYQRWQRGTDLLFMDAEAQEAYNSKYLDEIHINTATYSEEELDTRLQLFRTPTGLDDKDSEDASDGVEPSGALSTSCSVSSLFMLTILAVMFQV